MIYTKPMTRMKKAVFSALLMLFAVSAVSAQDAVTVQFYTPTTVRITKGGPAPASRFAVTAVPQAVSVPIISTSITIHATHLRALAAAHLMFISSS